MLQLKNIEYQQKDNKILHQIQLEIKTGEVVAFIGLSGCGKTSLARICSGLVPYFYDEASFSGEVFFDHVKLDEVTNTEFIKKVGVVSQDPKSQFFTTIVKDELAFEMENYGCNPKVIEQRIQQVSDALKLEDILNQTLASLSSGQKQKVAIATALMTDPSLVILDEPSANLDLVSTESLKEQIKHIKQQGKTIIIAEHRVYYLMDSVDRFIYMEDGQIVKELTALEMAQLSNAQRAKMGIRHTDLSEIENERKNQSDFSQTINVRDVQASVKRKKILQSVSYQHRAGEVLALIGKNGAGKTSLAKALSGLTHISSGKILLESQLLRKRALKKSVWMVMQESIYQVFGDDLLTELAIGKRNVDQVQIEKILKKMGLWAFRNQHPYNLSGGQRQRLVLAIGLIQQREILILDEPTSGLDGKNLTIIAHFLKELSREGKHILMITHDPEIILKSCDRILLLEGGKISQDKKISELATSEVLKLLSFQE